MDTKTRQWIEAKAIEQFNELPFERWQSVFGDLCIRNIRRPGRESATITCRPDQKDILTFTYVDGTEQHFAMPKLHPVGAYIVVANFLKHVEEVLGGRAAPNAYHLRLAASN